MSVGGKWQLVVAAAVPAVVQADGLVGLLRSRAVQAERLCE